jgi:Chemotaxis protein histidine kinase and related kinases
MVLQRLKDPIMHLLRNAVSHGLEAPKERLARGKEASGSLRLGIHCERRNLVVTVEDDGRGVDLERVREVALERNLISEAELAGATPWQVSRLIFAPSFSTTREVTGLSGRGMGLSVVHESAKSLQGDVELTNPGQAGTSISVTVPLSMSSTHVVLVSVAGSTFGIPSSGIARLFEIPSKHLAPVQGRPTVTLNGQQHRLFSLAQLLGFDPADSERLFHGERLAVMLLRAGSRRAAVLVEEYAGERDVLIQGLGIAALANGNVTGGAILDDATIALTLNAAGLVEACEQPDAPAMPSVKFRPKRAPASILVVDDSITTRSLEKSILETSGYRVRVAVDGIEALELLRIELSDLVITDVQMPRMDGLSLVAAIKADPRLQRIPVIMVSSLGNEEDQERGLANGADAYIVKQKFDQRQLLDAVEQSL